MDQWRFNINIFNFFVLIYMSYQIYLKDEFKLKEERLLDFKLEPGKVQMKYLNDTNTKPFIFNGKGINNVLIVNFYSLSCNIELKSYKKQNILSLNLYGNGISMRIRKNTSRTVNIIIKEKMNLINGINKYENKKNCPMIINTIDISNLSLLVEENEPTILYFDKNYLKKISLSYKIKEVRKNTRFITLSFSFNNISEFNINIPDIINTTISNSTTIHLGSKYLNNLKEDTLNINIEQFGNKYPCLLTFQIIEHESIYILQRDYINKGFIYSGHINTYYYMEVFEEEGEIILNNKRNSGKLLGIIKNKEGINPYNIKEYIKKEKDNKLEFNEHTQKLSFNSEDTKNCNKGCYLLVTYYNNGRVSPSIGYEYTLLVRIRDVDDFGPQIINIPFNEYLFGTFEENSFFSHYYSIFIPQGIKEIIMQIESNYVEGFIEKGKKKIINFKKLKNNLNLTEDKMIIKFSKDKLQDFIGKEISFSFKSKKFDENFFSFYIFRILILKENDTNLIYPLDSNIENICLPEKDKNKQDNYYCYALLSNNYNEFNNKFTISISNQNDNYNISVYEDYIKEKNISTKYYISEVTKVKNLKSILFKFEFEDNKPKNILSTFSNEKDLNYPQIYSPKLYTIFNASKLFNYNLNNGNCFLIFELIYGRGIIFFDNYPTIDMNENFIGKPITIQFSEVKNIYCKSNKEENFIFYLKLKYINQKSNIKEINYDESLNELLFNIQFPIFYYIKYNNQDNIDINFRIINTKDINTTTNIKISGYALNQDKLKRKLNGEFIELKEPIIGKYDKSFKNGLLQINETIINKYFKNYGMEYILIKIDADNYENFICNSLSVEIIAMSKNNGSYLIPVNQYIMGYISFNKIIYLIKNNVMDKKTDIIIEFSPNNKDIKLIFNKSIGILTYKENIINGIQKYRINTNNKEIILNINHPQGISNGNYLFRYYFIEINDDIFEYKFDKNSYVKKKIFDDGYKADICLEFNKFEIFYNKTLVSYNKSNIKGNEIYNGIKSKIRLKIYGFLYNFIEYNELLNTSAFNSSQIYYENNTEINYSDNNIFEICFMYENI